MCKDVVYRMTQYEKCLFKSFYVCVWFFFFIQLACPNRSDGTFFCAAFFSITFMSVHFRVLESMRIYLNQFLFISELALTLFNGTFMWCVYQCVYMRNWHIWLLTILLLSLAKKNYKKKLCMPCNADIIHWTIYSYRTILLYFAGHLMGRNVNVQSFSTSTPITKPIDFIFRAVNDYTPHCKHGNEIYRNDQTKNRAYEVNSTVAVTFKTNINHTTI